METPPKRRPRLHPRLDFLSASAQYVTPRTDGVHFAARRDDSPLSMWWHFALQGTPRDELRLIWEHTNDVLGYSGLGRVVPVYRSDRGWRRVPVGSCHYDAPAHRFRFAIPMEGRRVEVAYCYPYGLERAEALLAALQRHPGVRVRTIGESERGRPFRLVEMGHGDTHVWLTARHHAGEVSGAYVLEGLLQEAVRRPGLLERITIHAAPVMDVDGVAEGMYGKDRAPRDFNRDYVAAPCRPEVVALIGASEAVGRVNIFMDLHAPAPGDGTFMVPVCEPLASVAHWDGVWELARFVEAFAPPACPFRVADLSRGAMNWSGDLIMQTSTNFFQRRFDALAMTLETSYHRACNGKLLTPSGWQALGRALLDAIAVKVGERPAPEVGHIELPPSLVPRLRDWDCISWPALQVRQRRSWLEITGPDPADGAVMHRRVLPDPGRSARIAYRLEGEVRGLQVVVKGMDRRSGRPTGEVARDTFGLTAGQDWQTLAVPHRCGPYVLIVRVQGLKGRLDLRTA